MEESFEHNTEIVCNDEIIKIPLSDDEVITIQKEEFGTILLSYPITKC